MSSAAIAHSAGNLVRYDPQAAQQLRDAAAQARERQQQQQALRLVTSNEQRSPGEKALEGELLNKQQQRQQHHQQHSQGLNEEYLARHNEQRSRPSEGYQSPSHRAIAAYKSTAQLTHPADVDQVRLIDVYV